MSVDRAELDLQHMTERLLACRGKPKRQYFVEQIGRIWHPHRHSSFRTEHDQNRLHHPPTDASIQAVASFASDPSHFVRHAVAKTLSAHPDAVRLSIKTLIALLQDTDASVRIAATDGLQYASGFVSSENALDLIQFLADSIWSVRWSVASALANTCYRHDGWIALKLSIPPNPEFLDSWAWRARPFSEELRADPETIATIREGLATLGQKTPFGYAARELLSKLEPPTDSG